MPCSVNVFLVVGEVGEFFVPHGVDDFYCFGEFFFVHVPLSATVACWMGLPVGVVEEFCAGVPLFAEGDEAFYVVCVPEDEFDVVIFFVSGVVAHVPGGVFDAVDGLFAGFDSVVVDCPTDADGAFVV